MIKEYVEIAYIMLFRKLRLKHIPELEQRGMFCNFYKQAGGRSIDVDNITYDINRDINLLIFRPRGHARNLDIGLADILKNATPSEIYALYLRSSFETTERFDYSEINFDVHNFIKHYKTN